MTRLLSAFRRFLHWFSPDAEVARLLASRGEIADAPEFPDQLPTWQRCRLNATPHWCYGAPIPFPSTDEVIAAMEKQFRKSTFRRIR